MSGPPKGWSDEMVLAYARQACHEVYANMLARVSTSESKEEMRGYCIEGYNLTRSLPDEDFAAPYPAVPPGLVFVRQDKLVEALMLTDPPPILAPDGKTYVFKNPHAAEVLTRLSAILRELRP